MIEGMAQREEPAFVGQRRQFLVEWHLQSAPLVDLVPAQRALAEAGRRLTTEGEPLLFVRSTYLPSQHRWLCLFEAPDAATVRKAHEIAQLPLARIEEVVDLPVGVGQPA